MSDNIVLFYLFFIVVGFFTAMFGTIIGAGGGLVFVPLFMYWFPEWSPSMIVGTSLFSVMCNAISGSLAYLRQKKVYVSAALIFSISTSNCKTPSFLSKNLIFFVELCIKCI